MVGFVAVGFEEAALEADVAAIFIKRHDDMSCGC